MKSKSSLLLIAILLLGFKNIATAQPDSTRVAMNYFMAKDPGTNTSSANISMWPNPASGRVKIYVNSLQPGDRGQCILYNEAGKACAMQTISNGTNELFFGSLQRGMYYVKIILHNKIAITKKLTII